MDVNPVEYQCKLMNNRVDNVGKHFSYFLQGFSSYARKGALLRDKGDDLVDVITSFANTEPNNTTTRKQLHEFAHWLAMVQDFRHLSVTRLISKIMPPLQAYQKVTSDMKAHIKKCTNASDKTKVSLEAANKVKAKSGDTSAMFHTAFDVYRANARDTARQAEILRVHAKEFEDKKLKDTKNALLDFAKNEMMFHCRALEMYTAACRSLEGISAEDDLQEFLDAYELMDDAGIREGAVLPERVGTVRTPAEMVMRGSVSQPALHAAEGDESDEERGPYIASGPGRLRVNRAQSEHVTNGTFNGQQQHGPRGQTVQRKRHNIPLQESDTD